MFRLRFSAGLFLLLFFLTGCARAQVLSDSDSQVYRQLHKKFSRMESYSATVRLTVKGNKTENQYTMIQKVQLPDRAVVTLQEPTALAGVTTVFSGNSVSVSGETSLTVPMQETLNDLFLNEFFSQYYKSEETALSVSKNAENQGSILLETEAIPGNDKRYKLTLLCDTKTLEPKQMTVYDVGGNIRMTAEFSDFSYNPAFEPEIFMVEQSKR